MKNSSLRHVYCNAAAEIKLKILGTPFFEQNIKNINIERYKLNINLKGKPILPKSFFSVQKLSIFLINKYKINSRTQARSIQIRRKKHIFQ